MTTATEPKSKTDKAPDTRGLAGQTVGDTSICAVTQTQLIYRGYEIADLAANPERLNLKSPAILIFGEVAGLAAHGLVEDILALKELARVYA